MGFFKKLIADLRWRRLKRAGIGKTHRNSVAGRNARARRKAERRARRRR